MKRRRAFTLVETLMTMTMGSSLMLLAIGLVHQSMSTSKLAKLRGEHDRSIARLAQQFRRDVHSASEIQSCAPEKVTLSMNDGSTVTFKVEGTKVTWEKVSVDSVVAREWFQFDTRCNAKFAEHSKPKGVVLTVERKVEGAEALALPVDLRVLAAVGRWQLLERIGKELP